MADSNPGSSKPPVLSRRDTVQLDASTSANSNPATLQKIGSVLRDTETIAALLDVKNFDAVYERIKTLRTQKDRIDIVINEILEGGVNSLNGSRQQSTVGKSEELLSDVEAVKLSVLELHPVTKLNLDEIYNLLEDNSLKPDRSAIVRDTILKKIEEASQTTDLESTDVFQFLNSETDILNDMDTLINKYPQIEPHRIFKIIVTEFINSTNRVEEVSRQLNIDTNAGNPRDDGSKVLKEDLITNPLIRDTEKLAKLFPTKDKNEILMLLEARLGAPDRVQQVTEVLLSATTIVEPIARDVPDLKPQTSKGIKRSKGSFRHMKKVKRLKSQSSIKGKYISAPYPELEIEGEVELLHAVFRDCDPNYLYERLEVMAEDPERVHRLSHEMFENADYPKLKDRLKREQRERRLQQLQTEKLDIQDFVLMFPDSLDTFRRRRRDVGENYKRHCLIQLKNDFPLLSEEFIKDTMNEHHSLYYFSHDALQKFFEERDIKDADKAESSKHIMTDPRQPEVFPEVLDEYFFKELTFVKNEDDIRDYTVKIEETRDMRFKKAEEENKLMECMICCADMLENEIYQCNSKDVDEDDLHKVCVNCLMENVKEYMNQGRVVFLCMYDECDGIYELDIIKKMMSSKMFSILLRRIQEDEIRRADIKDLVSCPFCNFATIMTDPDDKILKCLNPDCLIESCRLCQEPNHVPLRCEEIVKQGASDMRSFVEMKMTEAMIRICWRCKKRYFKTQGCNRMTCSCGASMCYLCQRPINNYDHFDIRKDDGTVLCPLMSDAMDKNREDMEKAAIEAREEWLKDHPEDAELDYDPLDMVRKKTVRRKKPGLEAKEGSSDEEDYEEVEVNPLTEYYQQHGLLFDDIDEMNFQDDYIDEDEFGEAVQQYDAVQPQGENHGAQNDQDEPNDSQTDATETENMDMGGQNGATEPENTAMEAQNVATEPDNTATEVQNAATEPENTATEAQNGATDPENTAMEAQNVATEPDNTATEVQNAATEPENTATEAQNGATEPENTATEAQNGATEPDNTAMETQNPTSDGQNKAPDSENDTSAPVTGGEVAQNNDPTATDDAN